MGTMIDFARPDGSRCRGYLAEGGKGRPGVIVIQEWWGLNDQIMGVADRFARAGYHALAPDLYHGRVTENRDEASHLMDGLDFAGATHQDIRGAAQFLAARGGKVAAMGYCMGGALTIAACVHVPEVSAGICLYGVPPAEFAHPARIGVPLQGHFADRDDWCTPAAVDELERAMKAAGRNPEIHRYDAAHGFCNERRAGIYDAGAAETVWTRMSAFLATHVG